MMAMDNGNYLHCIVSKCLPFACMCHDKQLWSIVLKIRCICFNATAVLMNHPLGEVISLQSELMDEEVIDGCGAADLDHPAVPQYGSILRHLESGEDGGRLFMQERSVQLQTHYLMNESGK